MWQNLSQRAWFLPKVTHVKCKTCREHGNFHVPRKQFTSHANFWQGAWNFPCTLQRNICLGKVHGNFHAPCNETYGKVHGNCHVLCFMFYRKVHGNFHGYLAMKHTARYMEISMYLTIRFIAISMYLANKTYDETYLAICFVAGYLVSSIAKKYPCCPKRHRNFRRPALMYKRTLKRFIEHIPQWSTLLILSSLRQCVYSWQWQTSHPKFNS